jgi:uncharacterized membrane protein HdeD (DUF308 family)
MVYWRCFPGIPASHSESGLQLWEVTGNNFRNLLANLTFAGNIFIGEISGCTEVIVMADVIVYEESVRTVKWGTFVLLGLLSLVFGIVIFFYPGLTFDVLVVLFGVLMTVLAFLALVIALMSPGTSGRPALLLFAAIIGFIVGIGSIVAPQVFGTILAIIIAVVLFVIGLVNVIIALSEKTYHHRWLLFLMGLLSILFAILILINEDFFGYLVGAYFIIYGILSIIAGLALRSIR